MAEAKGYIFQVEEGLVCQVHRLSLISPHGVCESISQQVVYSSSIYSIYVRRGPKTTAIWSIKEERK